MSTYLRITLLFSVLTLLLMAIGYAVGLYFGDPLSFLLLGLIFAGLLNFVAYFYSDSLIIRMSRARIIQESENPALYGVVRSVAQKAGIPMPRVGVVDSPQPNAFATGRGPQRAVVVATSSILRILTPQELEAVIGHEIGHVIHRDVLIASVAATMAGVISYIGNIALWSMMWGGYGGRGRQNSGSPLPLLLAAILVPLGATFVQLGISRSAEYNADEYGAKLTHEPGYLISALRKITSKVNVQSFAPQNSNAPSPATASLWIVNPFRGHSLVELFSTHPTTEKRVARLKKVATEMGIYVG
jgi:heat shock protein HtpX